MGVIISAMEVTESLFKDTELEPREKRQPCKNPEEKVLQTARTALTKPLK